MNITSILLKKVILEADSETWVNIRKNYLSTEYQKVFTVVNKYFEENSHLPSFDALKLFVRSNIILDKIYAIEATETVDIENSTLLEFLKNEYTQEEIMTHIVKYLDESIMMESAKENVEKLQEIIYKIEDLVDLKDPEQDMQRIELFAPEEDINNSLPLGLNSEYDAQMKFAPGDYILIGGKRGAGKSLTCTNIGVTQYEAGRSALYFTIEMSAQAILQRCAAMATGVSAAHMRMRNLQHSEWLEVAKWWSGRFVDGIECYADFTKHNDFSKLHGALQKRPLNPDTQLDVIYDPRMTIGTIKSELDRKVAKLNPSVILVDYINQVKRSTHGQYEWTEQIEISKELKALAQEYGIPLISPYQIDASGEARFAKGILDSADAAFTLDAHNKEDECITFKCAKMRDHAEIDFTSRVNWDSLRIGPDSVEPPGKKQAEATGEDAHDV